MGIFWISFRIEVGGKGDERQFGLTKAIHGYKLRYWDRTPNFILFESGHTLDFLVHALRSKIDPARDVFLIGEVGSANVRLYGANTDPDILKMLPHCLEPGARP
jgi:hypothetical protein